MTTTVDELKLCKQCGILKDLFDFHRNKSLKCGRRPVCKDCISANNRLTRQKYPALAEAENRKRRTGRPVGRPAKHIPEDEVCELHLAGWPVGHLSSRYGVHDDRIKQILTQCGVSIRRGAWGEKHHRWKGGRYISSMGYVKVTPDRDDPYRSMADVNGAIWEHRLVMAGYLGRALRSDETVHHIDGNRQNNDITNLQLRIGHHGEGAAWECGDCGSHNLVPRVL